MSADLHFLATALGRLGTPAPAPPSAADLLRPVDAFVKAWYLGGAGADLRAWARGAAGVDLLGRAGSATPPTPLPRPVAACLLHAAGSATGQDRRAVASAVMELDAELAGAAAAAEMMAAEG